MNNLEPPLNQQRAVGRGILFPILFTALAVVLLAELGLYADAYLRPQTKNIQINVQEPNLPGVVATSSGNDPAATTVSANSTSSPTTATVGLDNRLNTEIYRLENYPIEESPVYQDIQREACKSFDTLDREDVRLIKDGSIIIPSIKQLISRAGGPGINDCYRERVAELSFPIVGDLFYFNIQNFVDGGGYYEKSNNIYSLDLTNFSVRRLSVSAVFSKVDFSTPIEDTYQISPYDQSRLVKYDMNGVYWLDLANDSAITLYTVPKDQWLVSSVESEMTDSAAYNVKILYDKILLGVYDRAVTEDGHAMSVQGNYSVVVKYSQQEIDSDKFDGRLILPKFIKRVVVPTPN